MEIKIDSLDQLLICNAIKTAVSFIRVLLVCVKNLLAGKNILLKRGKKMGKITVETCEIEGLKVITPTVFGDERGYFMETYNYNDYKAAGIDMEFVQDNQSSSKKGVLRGLHFQINYPQDKLVRVVSGEVFDVAVDLRPGSETYGKWFWCCAVRRE